MIEKGYWLCLLRKPFGGNATGSTLLRNEAKRMSALAAFNENTRGQYFLKNNSITGYIFYCFAFFLRLFSEAKGLFLLPWGICFWQQTMCSIVRLLELFFQLTQRRSPRKFSIRTFLYNFFPSFAGGPFFFDFCGSLIFCRRVCDHGSYNFLNASSKTLDSSVSCNPCPYGARCLGSASGVDHGVRGTSCFFFF